MCRCSTSFLAEAATIILSFPGQTIGHAAKNVRETDASGTTDDRLARNINTALFNYLRFREHVYEFDVDDPIPHGDTVYGKP